MQDFSLGTFQLNITGRIRSLILADAVIDDSAALMATFQDAIKMTRDARRS